MIVSVLAGLVGIVLALVIIRLVPEKKIDWVIYALAGVILGLIVVIQCGEGF